MLKNPYIKLSLAVGIVLTLACVITLKYGSLGRLAYGGSVATVKQKGQIKSGSKEMGENDAPDYFSLFKLVTNFIPGKKSN